MMRSGRAYLAILVVVAGAAFGGALFAEGPAQPIDFSHRVHAGDNQISCFYCHTGASRSASAGVPAVGTCYECHRIVKLKEGEIAKVLKYAESKQPISWVRVHSLPDYVYFAHKPHIRRGIACQDCHGEVQKMDRVSQQAPLTMGWCLNCHEQRGGPRECDVCHK